MGKTKKNCSIAVGFRRTAVGYHPNTIQSPPPPPRGSNMPLCAQASGQALRGRSSKHKMTSTPSKAKAVRRSSVHKSKLAESYRKLPSAAKPEPSLTAQELACITNSVLNAGVPLTGL